MKKRFFLLLSILIVFAVLNSSALAEEKATIYGDKVECESGETIRYSVNIKGNPGVAGFLISVSSQEDWLYFDEEVEQGDFSDEGSITTSYDPQRINVLWFNADNVNGDGTLFSFDVHVSPSAPSRDYPIVISISDKNTLNDKYQTVNFDAVDGCIKVEHVDRTAEEISEITGQNAQDNSNLLWIFVASVAVVIGLLLVLYCKKKK